MVDYAPPRSPPRWCEDAPRRRDLGPGLLRSPTPAAPGLPLLSGNGDGDTLAGLRPEGLDEPGPVLAPTAASCITGRARGGGHRGITPSSSTWTLRDHRHPIETLHGVAEFAEVFFDDVVVPSIARSSRSGRWWAVARDLLPYERSTALWHRGALMPPADGRAARRVPEGALPRQRVGTSSTAVRLPGPLPAPPSTAPLGERLGRRRRWNNGLATAEQRSTSWWRGLGDDVLFGDDVPPAVAVQILLRPAAKIYGGSAEITEQHHRKRLCDLGSDGGPSPRQPSAEDPPPR